MLRTRLYDTQKRFPVSHSIIRMNTHEHLLCYVQVVTVPLETFELWKIVKLALGQFMASPAY